jgi:hypothetical protein
MSTTPSAEPAVTIAVPPAQREIRVYSHSALFYWWPVWAVGFLMALLTLVDGERMVVVPADTKPVQNARVEYVDHEGKRVTAEPKDVLIVEKGSLPKDPETDRPFEPHLLMAQSAKPGVLYAVVLLLIIVISNVPLRGLWSLMVILLIILLSLIFALAHIGDRTVWDWLVEKFRLLDIRINLGGYLFISLVLFIIWAITVFVFDHRTYVAITSGQVRVCLAVGAGETVYDTTGMTFQKRQDDLFRHWIVGLGSGDLIIHRTNTNQEIDMPNVLFIGAKIKEIETLIKEREVV